MRPHLDAHSGGVLRGAVPADYCRTHGLDNCSVCGMLVAARFNGVHPRCRPSARTAVPSPASHPVGGGNAPDIDGLPDLATIFSANIPVLRHVPKAARGAWAQCLARALAQVAGHNSLRAWRALLILPKTVLRPAPRGGARRREQAARFTQRCCARWLEGEREELWSEGPARRPKQASEQDEAAVLARRHARCISLAGEGELSRACAALVDPPLLAESTEVLNSLRAKHPHASPARPGLQSQGPPSRRDVPDISSAEVLKAVRGFRRGSAPGPTGLRGDHVREALSTAHADEVTYSTPHRGHQDTSVRRGPARARSAPGGGYRACHAKGR